VEVKMPKEKKDFEEIMNQFMQVKIKAQDASYGAIFDFNAGNINYAECQGIVFDSFQKITGEVIREFSQKRFS